MAIMTNNEFILKLHEVGAVKFGSFTLKTGLQSPVYFDLRVLVSYPDLLSTCARLMLDRRPPGPGELLCGVPYTALPIATVMAVESKLGMVIRRKEAKSYGTKKLIEGVWEQGQSCVIVEDVITSGGSVADTVQVLRDHGMTVTHCVVLLDREQGGRANLEDLGVTVTSIMSISQVVQVLSDNKKISDDMVQSVLTFIANNQTNRQKEISPEKVKFSERVNLTQNKVTHKLLKIMMEKKTNICVAVDCVNSQELLNIAQTVGPHVAVIKIHQVTQIVSLLLNINCQIEHNQLQDICRIL